MVTENQQPLKPVLTYDTYILHLYVYNIYIYLQFLEKIQFWCDSKARANNVYIVGSCGWDSIPADMGVTYTREQFQGNIDIKTTNFVLQEVEIIIIMCT